MDPILIAPIAAVLYALIGTANVHIANRRRDRCEARERARSDAKQTGSTIDQRCPRASQVLAVEAPLDRAVFNYVSARDRVLASLAIINRDGLSDEQMPPECADISRLLKAGEPLVDKDPDEIRALAEKMGDLARGRTEPVRVGSRAGDTPSMTHELLTRTGMALCETAAALRDLARATSEIKLHLEARRLVRELIEGSGA